MRLSDASFEVTPAVEGSAVLSPLTTLAVLVSFAVGYTLATGSAPVTPNPGPAAETGAAAPDLEDWHGNVRRSHWTAD